MTATAKELHEATAARLRTIPGITVYDGGEVPGSPPADSEGRVYPYAVVWPGAGDPPGERATTGATGLLWGCHVTLAAGRQSWLLAAVPRVIEALDRFEAAPGVRLEHEPLGARVGREPEVTPARWYVPTAWRALAP